MAVEKITKSEVGRYSFVPALGGIYEANPRAKELIEEARNLAGAVSTTTYEGSDGDTPSAKMIQYLAKHDLAPVKLSGILTDAKFIAHTLEKTGEVIHRLNVELTDEKNPKEKNVLSLDLQHPSGHAVLKKLAHAKLHDVVEVSLFSKYEMVSEGPYKGRFFTNIVAPVKLNGQKAEFNQDLQDQAKALVEKNRQSLVAAGIKDQKILAESAKSARNQFYSEVAKSIADSLEKTIAVTHPGKLNAHEEPEPIEQALEEEEVELETSM